MTRRGWPPWAPLLLIAAAATLPYLPGVASPFVQWDDLYYVPRSPSLRLGGWSGFWAQWDFMLALDNRRIEFFPLRDQFYWLLWHGFGRNPVPYHLVNLAFHSAASVLVWRLALRLGLTPWAALVGGLLFATHPVHVESVVWISALKDPMFLSAMLGSIVCYLRYRNSLRPFDYGASLLLLMAALACKSLALPTVLLLLAIERVIGAATPWRLIAVRLVGPAAITAVSFWHILALGKANDIILGPHGGGWFGHWQLTGWAMVRYIQQAFVPHGFRLHYCFPNPEGLSDPRLWVTLAMIPAVGLCCVLAWKKHRTLGLLCLWFFACLGPVSNILPFPALMADRYLYAPTVGTVLISAWLLETVRWRNALAVALVVVYAGSGLARSQTWQHEWQLWDEVAGDEACWGQDTSIITFNVLMMWGATQAEPVYALEAFQRVAREPTLRSYFQFDEMTCERFDTSTLRKPLADPELELRAAEMGALYCPKSPDAWQRLGFANWARRPDISSRAMEKAYQADPISFRRWQLGMARANAGDVDGARQDIAAALAWEPAVVCPSFLKWLGALGDDQRAAWQPLEAHCPEP